jgi:cell division protein FtsA
LNHSSIQVSCDIGTSAIKVVVAQVEKDSINILGVGTAQSKGIKKGIISDMQRIVESIKEAVAQAERMSDLKINKVHVGIGALYSEIHQCQGVTTIRPQNTEITYEHLDEVRNDAERVHIGQDREMIDLIPLKYKVDNVEGIEDPRNIVGNRLEMDSILISGLVNIVQSTKKAVGLAGLEVASVVYTPMSSGSLLLRKDEKRMGSALIDVGAGIISVAVFGDSQLQLAYAYPLGGDFIISDLSNILKISMEDAEKLLKKYGNAFVDERSENRLINIPMIGTEKQQQVGQLDISRIINARVRQFFEIIRNDLENRGIYGIIYNYVITGGVAKMPGFLRVAEEVLESNVRVDYPNFISVREPMFTNSVSIITYAVNRARKDGYDLVDCVGDSHDDELSGNFSLKMNNPFKRGVKQSKQQKEESKGFTEKMGDIFTKFFE